MNNNSNVFPVSPPHQRGHSPYDFRSAAYIKEQTVKSHEQQNTDLVIETKEGDKVTISSNSYSRLDSYTYDSKGMAQTSSGAAAYSQSIREISLSTGKSFSFSVQGDLSEEELEDIEEMLQGLDEIIADVRDGDMKGAVEGAMGLGGFESFSAYAVDISYQKTYEMSSTIAAAVSQGQYAANPEKVEDPSSEGAPTPQLAGKRGLVDVEKLFDRLVKQIGKHDEKLPGFAKDPINKLFDHHLDDLQEKGEEENSLVHMIEEVMDKVDTFIEEVMVGSENEKLAEPEASEE